jgi:diguanylate cyclase (GGDEF)-like protein
MDTDARLSVVLREFARTVATDFRIETVLDHLATSAVSVLQVGGAGVTLISPGADPRLIAASDDAAMGFERLQSELGEGPCVGASETGKAVSVPSLREDDRFPRFAACALEQGLEAVFTFPLNHGDERLGALDVYRTEIGPLDATAMRAGQILADVASAYLINAQVRVHDGETSDRARQDARHDALTGLPNRTVLLERLDHAIQRTRPGELIAVMTIDLDQFRVINGAYGHEVGDQLLVALAERLTGRLRGADTVCRLCCDEFVVVWKDVARASGVDDITAQIELAISERFVLADAEVKITASVGVALGNGEHGAEHLLDAAGTAMHRAKRQGGARCASTYERATAGP